MASTTKIKNHGGDQKRSNVRISIGMPDMAMHHSVAHTTTNNSRTFLKKEKKIQSHIYLVISSQMLNSARPSIWTKIHHQIWSQEVQPTRQGKLWQGWPAAIILGYPLYYLCAAKLLGPTNPELAKTVTKCAIARMKIYHKAILAVVANHLEEANSAQIKTLTEQQLICLMPDNASVAKVIHSLF